MSFTIYTPRTSRAIERGQAAIDSNGNCRFHPSDLVDAGIKGKEVEVYTDALTRRIAIKFPPPRRGVSPADSTAQPRQVGAQGVRRTEGRTGGDRHQGPEPGSGDPPGNGEGQPADRDYRGEDRQGCRQEEVTH